jgi:hypothetical protein
MALEAPEFFFDLGRRFLNPSRRPSADAEDAGGQEITDADSRNGFVGADTGRARAAWHDGEELNAG